MFGLGGVGLSAVMGARLAGCNPIVAVDIVDAKLELALELGATHAVRADDPDALTRIREITAGGGETVVEAVGRVAVLEMAFDATRRGGTTVAAGLPAPDKVMALSPLRLVAEERTLKGSYMGSGVPRRDVPRLLALAQVGPAPDRPAGERDPPARRRSTKAFDRLADGTAVRQLLTFD